MAATAGTAIRHAATGTETTTKRARAPIGVNQKLTKPTRVCQSTKTNGAGDPYNAGTLASVGYDYISAAASAAPPIAPKTAPVAFVTVTTQILY